MDIEDEGEGSDVAGGEELTKPSRVRTNNGSEQIKLENLFQLTKQQCTKLISVQSYKYAREELEIFTANLTQDDCKHFFENLDRKVNFKSMEAFLSTYYGHIVQYGSEMIAKLSESTSKILLIKLADSLYILITKREKEKM